MSQAYSNPNRESDPYSLPDVEVFFITAKLPIPEIYSGPGWYWWSRFPGCLPDSDPFGPFATEAEALADAQDNGERRCTERVALLRQLWTRHQCQS